MNWNDEWIINSHWGNMLFACFPAYKWSRGLSPWWWWWWGEGELQGEGPY